MGTSVTPRGRVDIGGIVPVRDEEDSLEACLDALAEAARRVEDRARVHLVVVLDRCTDRSAALARRRGVLTVPLLAGNVGRARAAGCEVTLAHAGPDTWLTTTDGDSQVDPTWFSRHLDAIDHGWDALVGTVAVHDWRGHSEVTRRRLERDYAAALAGDHRHVHGANLGVRGAAYRAVGGFRALATGEDVALVADLERAGFRIRRTRSAPVVTSARRHGRAPAGFAANLRRLDTETTIDARGDSMA